MKKDEKLALWSERIHDFQTSGQSCKASCSKSNPYFYNGILDAQITKYWKLDIKIKDINVCKKDELIEENCIFYDCITENCMEDWDDFIDEYNKMNWK